MSSSMNECEKALEALGPMPEAPTFSDYTLPPRPSNARIILQELALHLGGYRAAFAFCHAFAGLTLQIPVPDELNDLGQQRRIAEALGQQLTVDRARELSSLIGSKSWAAAAILVRQWTGCDVKPYLRGRINEAERERKERSERRRLSAAARGREKAWANLKARRSAPEAVAQDGGDSAGSRPRPRGDAGDGDDRGEAKEEVRASGRAVVRRVRTVHPRSDRPGLCVPAAGAE